MNLQEFIREPGTKRAWIEEGVLQIYIRWWLGELQIARVTSDKPGVGEFTKFLDRVESEFEIVKIESVLTSTLKNYLLSRGYEVAADWSESVDMRKTWSLTVV